MTDPPTPRRRRWWWSRTPLIALCVVGAVAVIVVATIHPWTSTSPPQFTLESFSVAFTGSGADAVEANSLCVDRCPVTVSAGQNEQVAFTVQTDATIGCGATPYYSITKVTETTSGGAFELTAVSADTAKSPLPVTIPNPPTGTDCVTTAQIWVTFHVLDRGASSQTLALSVAVASES